MSIISHAVALVVDTIVKHYFNKPAAKRIEADWQGNFTLRMRKRYYILGRIYVVFACAITALLVFKPPVGLFTITTAAFFLLAFLGAGVLYILYYRNHWVTFDDTYIEVSNPRGNVITTTWNKIVKAKFNLLTDILTLTDEDGQKLKLAKPLTGLNTFVTLLKQKTGLTSGVEDYMKRDIDSLSETLQTHSSHE